MTAGFVEPLVSQRGAENPPSPLFLTSMKPTSSYLTSLPFVNSDIDNSHSDPLSFTLDFHFSALDTHSPSRGLPFPDAALDASVTSVHFRPPFPCVSFLSLNSNRAYCVGRAVLDSFVSSAEVVLFQEPWCGQVGSAKSDVSPDGSSVYGFVHQRSWPLAPSQVMSTRISLPI
jgi:hypothetical protein